jgi:ankyrin repeat protein
MTSYNTQTQRLGSGQNKLHNPSEDIVGAGATNYHPTHHQKQPSRYENEKSPTDLLDFRFDTSMEAKSKDIGISGMYEEDIISPIDPALRDFYPHNRLSNEFTYSPYDHEAAQHADQNRRSKRFSQRLSSILSIPTFTNSNGDSNGTNSSSNRPRPSRKSSDLTDLLCTAASTGNTQFLGRILGAGGDISKRNSQGLTPLHVAAQAGQGDSVRCLVRMGAPIAGRDAQGFTALHRAVVNRHRHLIPHLTNLGADVNEKTAGGKMALHLAAEMPSSAADIGGQEHISRASTPSSSAGSNRSSNLRFSYAFNGQGSDRRPSHGSLASSYDDCSVIEALVRAGANMECRDRNGDTALHVAVRAGNLQNVTILLDQGAGINVSNKAGLTPLAMLASQNERNEGLCQLLLARGAVVTPIEKKQQSWIGRAVL